MAKRTAAPAATAEAKPPAADTRTPPHWARHHGLAPPDAAGVRVTGGWELHDEVSGADYAAALKSWQEGSSHG